MSIIAWDGRSVAADRQSTQSDMRRPTRKIVLLATGEILACVGDEAGGLSMFHWYREGAKREQYPAAQGTDRWTRLIVINRSGAAVYEQSPDPIIIRRPFMAWGSGRDFAMGAMAMGANARRAVEIASRFNTYCGMGIHVVRIR